MIYIVFYPKFTKKLKVTRINYKQRINILIKYTDSTEIFGDLNARSTFGNKWVFKKIELKKYFRLFWKFVVYVRNFHSKNHIFIFFEFIFYLHTVSRGGVQICFWPRSFTGRTFVKSTEVFKKIACRSRKKFGIRFFGKFR